MFQFQTCKVVMMLVQCTLFLTGDDLSFSCSIKSPRPGVQLPLWFMQLALVALDPWQTTDASRVADLSASHTDRPISILKEQVSSGDARILNWRGGGGKLGARAQEGGGAKWWQAKIKCFRWGNWGQKQVQDIRDKKMLTRWRLVPSILGLGSMGNTCYSKI